MISLTQFLKQRHGKRYLNVEAKLQDSRLWNAMVEARAKHLIQEAIGIE